MLSLRTLVKRTALSGALVAAGCDSSSVVGLRDFARFAEARARWDARPFGDYSYEIRTSCFCPPEINRWTRVSVRSGVVVDADPVEPDPSYPITTLAYWHPIDTLFESLRRAMSESGSQSYLEAIVVDYDSELGYPTSIEYRAKSNVADGGSSLSLRNVGPLD